MKAWSEKSGEYEEIPDMHAACGVTQGRPFKILWKECTKGLSGKISDGVYG